VREERLHQAAQQHNWLATVVRRRQTKLTHSWGPRRDAQRFDVHTPEFQLRLPFTDPPALTVGDVSFAAKPLEHTVGTPPDGGTSSQVMVVGLELKSTKADHNNALRNDTRGRVRLDTSGSALGASAVDAHHGCILR
jgi:hypothetical protein